MPRIIVEEIHRYVVNVDDIAYEDWADDDEAIALVTEHGMAAMGGQPAGGVEYLSCEDRYVVEVFESYGGTS